MKRRGSIALNLALGLSLMTAVLWVGAASIAVGVLRHELNEAYDDSLRQSALRLLPLAIHDIHEPWERRLPVVGGSSGFPAPDEDLDDESFTYFVRNAAGEVVLRDEDVADDAGIEAPAAGYGEWQGQRTYSLTDARSGYGIVIVEASKRREGAISDSVAGLAWPLAALLPLIGLGIWFAMRLALRPLIALRDDIARRDGRNLEPLSADGHPVELAPIADAVAGLLERLKSAMDMERSFAARSAHELRTPIAGALAQTQQLAAELSDSPRLGRVHEIEAALRRLSALSEKLLQLSRLDAGFARTDQQSDLVPVVKLMVRDANRFDAEDERVTLDLGGRSRMPVPIDADAFAIALRNLIDNALVHGAKGGRVTVTIDAAGQVHVRSDGPVVAPETLAQLGQPFVRGDTDGQGTGLGLSIVSSILRQAGGSLTLLSPAQGSDRGFEAVIGLPGQSTGAVG